MNTRRIIWATLVTLSGLVAASAASADGCTALKQACKAAGFHAGASASGIGIGANCIDPLLNGATPPGTGNLALPAVAADDVAACAAVKGTGSTKAKAVAKESPAIDGAPAPGGKPAAALAPPKGSAAGPNIVFVLADDFSLNLMTTQNNILAQSMPNLAKMMREGASFSQYFVTDSLCCPSRTSIFTGMFPHNSGVYTNTSPDGGFGKFMAQGDDGKTFAVALHDKFYQTAMMGKYLNGYEPTRDGVGKGWSDWAVAGNGYPNYNYALDNNGILDTPPAHLTDQISELGQTFIKQAVGSPFFLELATFSPHAPYVPPTRYANAFADIGYPVTPAYQARPDAAAPSWLKAIPPISQNQLARLAEDFRKRVRSDKGIDDMIGAVRKELADLGLADNTYVIFSSDNGYHMGEYSMYAGKQTPFDTDIHVPLVIVGPGIAAGTRIDDITMNVDFAPTFRELAGLAPSASVDGHSLVALLHGGSEAKRNMALVEHVHTGPRSDNPDAQTQKSGDPPNYVALRLADAMYVEYDGGEVNYYDLKADPYELHNIAGTLSAEKLKALHAALQANHSCVGTAACMAAQGLAP